MANADLAGGEWGQRSRDAAIFIEGSIELNTSLGIKLLEDIRHIRMVRKNLISNQASITSNTPVSEAIAKANGNSELKFIDDTYVASSALVILLNQLEARPWKTYGKARLPIDQSQLAELLKAYDIVPKDKKIPGETNKVRKSYLWEKFEDSWNRLLLPYVEDELKDEGEGPEGPGHPLPSDAAATPLPG